jgi:hypothetical protein
MKINALSWIVAFFVPSVAILLTVIIWRKRLCGKVRELETDPGVELSGVQGADANGLRVAFLRNLMDNAHKSEEFIQSSRERTFHLALVAFAGILAFLYKNIHELDLWFASIVFFAIIYCLFLHDLRLHRFRHGWRTTESELGQLVARAINEPNCVLEVPLYDRKGEEKAARWGEFGRVQRLIYYLMLVTSFLAPFLIVTWARQTK